MTISTLWATDLKLIVYRGDSKSVVINIVDAKYDIKTIDLLDSEGTNGINFLKIYRI